MKELIFYLVFLCGLNFGQNIIRLPNAHSHNDYNRTHPLYNALDNGFTSIEADVLLIGDELYVAHEPGEIKKNKTLKTLYLEPLKEILKDKESKYAKLFPIVLLVDIKSEALPTYNVLEKQLEQYKELVTTYKDDSVFEKKINVIISGNRPIDYMVNQKERLAAIDGRLEDISKSEFLYPLISGRIGGILGEERDKDSIKVILANLAEKVHNNNKKLRVWGAPDNEESWEIQYNSKLDIIGTDAPNALKDFLLKKPDK